ncbi:Wings apart-like protein [Phaffia rhodozyma]|uniref:Wings apart-like protein n=1 Tax=Phaffia rhodozyma TaxID=264483 RepID=A0A0F7SJ60_PHARH|nr:Wings apart-like protein [Phaffia rhodozyma]
MKRNLSATYSRAARRRTSSASTGAPLVRKLGELSDSSSSEDDNKTEGKAQPGAKRQNSLGELKEKKRKEKESLGKQSIGPGEKNVMERGTALDIIYTSPSKASQSRSLIHGGSVTADDSHKRMAIGARKSNELASPAIPKKSRAKHQNHSIAHLVPSPPVHQITQPVVYPNGPSSPLSSPPSDRHSSLPVGSTSSSPSKERIRTTSPSMSTPTKPSPSKSPLEDTFTKPTETGAETISSIDLKNISPSRKHGMIDLIKMEQEEDLPEFGLQMFKLPKNRGGLANRMMKRAGSSQDASGSSIGPTESITNGLAAVTSPSVHPALSNLAARSSLFESLNSSGLPVEENSDIEVPPTPTSQLIPSVTIPPAKPQLSSNKTYGGTSRSMLATAEAGSDVEGEGTKRESYLTLAKRWGVDKAQELKEQTIGLPTLNELRARGENQRFLDDLGYIMDGLQGDSLAVKRPSAVDLIRRMLDTDFRISIKTLDEAANLYKILRKAGAGAGDYVLDASLVLYLGLLAQDSKAVEVILTSHSKDCFNVVGEMIKTKNDGFSAERKREAEGKAVKPKDKTTSKLLNELARIYSVSDLDCKTFHISLRGIASSFLASIVAADKGARFDRHLALMQTGIAETSITSLEAELGTLPGRLKDHEIGLPLLPKHEPPDIGHAERCLFILESLFLRFEEVKEIIRTGHPQLPSLLGTLLAVALRITSSLENYLDKADEIATNCVTGCLRVLVNITHSQTSLVTDLLACPTIVPTIFRLINTSTSLPLPVDDSRRTLQISLEMDVDYAGNGHIDDAEDQKIEVLCLALSLLNNLVEKTEELKDRVRMTEMSKTCNGSRMCVSSCRCPERRSVLHILVDLFVSQSKQNASPEASYLSGYAVLLLSHFMKNNQTNVDLIIEALRATTDEPSDAASTASSLAAYLKDFADVHQRFHQKITTIARITLGNDSDVSVEDAVGLTDGNEWDKVTAKIQTEELPAVIPSVEEGVDAIRSMALEMEQLASRLAQSAAC